jgi:WD40 repeat protein
VRVAALAITTVSASPDGQLLAIVQASDAGHTAQLWAEDGSNVAALADGGVVINCLAWSPDGSLVAGASPSGDVRLWDRQGRLVRILHGTDPVFSLAWSPDGKVLAAGAIHFPAPAATGLVALPGVIQLWSRDGTPDRTLATQSTGGKFLNLGWSPDGSMLAAGASDYVVWRADGSQVGVPRTGGTPAWAMAWSPDGRALAIGDENGTLEIVAPDGSMRGLSSFAGGVNAISYSPDGALLAVGHGSGVSVVAVGDPRTVLWSVATVSSYSQWSSDGSRLMVSTADGLSLIAPGGVRHQTLKACQGSVSALYWDGPVVVAGTETGWLCSWRSPAP